MNLVGLPSATTFPRFGFQYVLEGFAGCKFFWLVEIDTAKVGVYLQLVGDILVTEISQVGS